jgi:MFS family permease
VSIREAASAGRDAGQPAAESPAPAGLWSAEHRALTIGLVLTITFIASEALAVVTIMPVVARDLSGLRLYGWVFSAFMLGDVVGIVVAGRQTDRYGPARPFIGGLVLFGAGLLLGGLAPTMLVLVCGRALQGIGAGAVPAVAYVAIGRTLPDHLRARMMAVLSTAWVLPGLAGPAVSAAVAALFGWRWVFLGLLPLVAVTGSLAVPALVRLGRPDRAQPGQASERQPGGHDADARGANTGQTGVPEAGPDGARHVTAPQPGTEHSLPDGLAAAAGAALILAGLTLVAGSGEVIAGVGLLIVGAGALGRSLHRLLPAGTFTARPGLPVVVLCRGLLTFTFFGADAYVTLTITTVRHHTPVLAGLAVTGATLAWTAGAWLQSRLNRQWEARRLVGWGVAIVVVGLAAMSTVLLPATPVAVGIAAWTIAGFGIGLAYAPISLLMLRTAPPGREGWAAASLSLTDVLGTALGIGAGGAAVAAATAHGWPLATGVGIAFAIAGVGAVAFAAASRRLPLSLTAVPGSGEGGSS